MNYELIESPLFPFLPFDDLQILLFFCIILAKCGANGRILLKSFVAMSKTINFVGRYA
jgi:hypothetical protein